MSTGRRRGHPIVVAWALVRGTVDIALRYRVTSLAAEVGFFALLSLPPLVLAVAASAAWVTSEFTSRGELEAAVEAFLTPFLTEAVVTGVILPTLAQALDTPRYDVISIGFVFALWSGSRALHVYLDTISIMYGLAGGRGIVKSRALSFSLYLVFLLLGSVSFPLVMVGPGLINDLMPVELEWLGLLYWPVVGVFGALMITWLFHLSVPVRTRWWRNLPGAALALGIWVLASWVMRIFLAISLSPSAGPTRAMSIYGPLTTPIVLMIWLYLLALGVLIGAALNAAIDRRYPDGERSARRAELAEQLARESAMGSTLTPVRDRDVEERFSTSPGAAAAFNIGKADTTGQQPVTRRPTSDRDGDRHGSYRDDDRHGADRDDERRAHRDDG